MFNYIINIHNSEAHLEQVLDAVMKCRGMYSKIFCILDGCTDGSERIVSRYPMVKIITSDIRETLAINVALRHIKESGNVAKYNIILQDDVIIVDSNIEQRLLNLFQTYPKVGIVGLRHGANIADDCLSSGKPACEKDIVQNAMNSLVGDYPTLDEGEMTFRQIVYKSPICVTKECVDALDGGYDETFAPIHHDDTEFCIRARNKGFNIAVLGFKIYQPREWSGCIRFGSNMGKLDYLQQEHMDLIRSMYREEIVDMIANPPANEIIKLW